MSLSQVSLPAAERQHKKLYSIGQVLNILSDSFSDLSASKLRFLEDQKLITPQRTDSGYRKYTQGDIERLRLILTLQSEHFLPLKAILDILSDIDSGKDPVIPGAAVQNVSSIFTPQKLLTLDELAAATGVSAGLIRDAIRAGILPSAEVFPASAVNLVAALNRLSERGITPRHLQPLRLAAEKEAENIAQSVRARNGRADAHERYEQALMIAELYDTVRSAVVRGALRRS